MYYTNVDLYANLKQLRGLCRQGPLPRSCWGQRLRLAEERGSASSPSPQSRLGDPHLRLRAPARSLLKVSAEPGL